MIKASLCRRISNVTATFTHNMYDKFMYLLACIGLCGFIYSNGKIVCFKKIYIYMNFSDCTVTITNIVGDGIETGTTACSTC